MRKRKWGITVMAVGAVLIVISLLAPAAIIAEASQKAPIAIIGGAEENVPPVSIIGGADTATYIYVYQSASGGMWIALTALGVLALVTGVIVLLADVSKKEL